MAQAVQEQDQDRVERILRLDTENVDRSVFESAMHQQIMERLVDDGYNVRYKDGHGRFIFDFVIYDDDGNKSLAVQIDNDKHYENDINEERDYYVPEYLAARG